jgi:hypothetical protein
MIMGSQRFTGKAATAQTPRGLLFNENNEAVRHDNGLLPSELQFVV